MTTANRSAIPAEGLVTLATPFEDARGRIQTLVEGGINSVQIITSLRHTIRANHYHKTDSHYMYVVQGAMMYYSRPVGSRAEPAMVTVSAGQMVFTPPMVEHAVFFPEDCVFVNITTHSRDQESYEKDLVRVELLKAPPERR